MKHLSLIILSLAISFNYNIAFAKSSTPALPTLEKDKEHSLEKTSESLFEKIKNFFGFGESEKQPEKEDERTVTSTVQQDSESEKESFIDLNNVPLPTAEEEGPTDNTSAANDKLALPADIINETDKTTPPEPKPTEEKSDKTEPLPADAVAPPAEKTEPEATPSPVTNGQLQNPQEEKVTEPAPVGNKTTEEAATSQQEEQPQSPKEENATEPAPIKEENKTAGEAATNQQEEQQPNHPANNEEKQMEEAVEQATEEPYNEEESEEPVMEERESEEDTPAVSTATKDSAVAKFKQSLQEKLKRAKSLPTIPSEELVNEQVADIKMPEVNGTIGEIKENLQAKFISDEAKVLLLPNDDIVLGELTTQAKIELMDMSAYSKLFWDNYNQTKRAPARERVEKFIENYHENFES